MRDERHILNQQDNYSTHINVIKSMLANRQKHMFLMLKDLVETRKCISELKNTIKEQEKIRTHLQLKEKIIPVALNDQGVPF